MDFVKETCCVCDKMTFFFYRRGEKIYCTYCDIGRQEEITNEND